MVNLGSVGEGKDMAALVFGNEQPIAAGRGDKIHRVIEPQFGESNLSAVRRRRLGRANDAGSRPQCSLFDAKGFAFSGSQIRRDHKRDSHQQTGDLTRDLHSGHISDAGSPTKHY